MLHSSNHSNWAPLSDTKWSVFIVTRMRNAAILSKVALNGFDCSLLFTCCVFILNFKEFLYVINGDIFIICSFRFTLTILPTVILVTFNSKWSRIINNYSKNCRHWLWKITFIKTEFIYKKMLPEYIVHTYTCIHLSIVWCSVYMLHRFFTSCISNNWLIFVLFDILSMTIFDHS